MNICKFKICKSQNENSRILPGIRCEWKEVPKDLHESAEFVLLMITRKDQSVKKRKENKRARRKSKQTTNNKNKNKNKNKAKETKRRNALIRSLVPKRATRGPANFLATPDHAAYLLPRKI